MPRSCEGCIKSRDVNTHHEGSVDVDLLAPGLLTRFEVHLAIELRVGGATRMARVGSRECAQEEAGGYGNDGSTRQQLRRQLGQLRFGRCRSDRTDKCLMASGRRIMI